MERVGERQYKVLLKGKEKEKAIKPKTATQVTLMMAAGRKVEGKAGKGRERGSKKKSRVLHKGTHHNNFNMHAIFTREKAEG